MNADTLIVDAVAALRHAGLDPEATAVEQARRGAFPWVDRAALRDADGVAQRGQEALRRVVGLAGRAGVDVVDAAAELERRLSAARRAVDAALRVLDGEDRP